MSIQPNEIQTHRFEYATPADPADFNPADFVEKAVAWVKSLVKPGEKIALSASGGVDSTVAAFLLMRGQHWLFSIGPTPGTSDRDKGEGVGNQEYTAIKIEVLAPLPAVLAPLAGKKVYCLAGTDKVAPLSPATTASMMYVPFL